LKKIYFFYNSIYNKNIGKNIEWCDNFKQGSVKHCNQIEITNVKKSANYIFKALAFETLGPWSLECKTFIDFIGAKLIIESGDSRAKFFFYQRISLAIQRGNAASILDTLPYVTPLEEVHCL
jgi:hypothetical protein